VALQSNSGLDGLTVDVVISHTITHTHPVGSDQLVAEASTCATQNTKDEHNMPSARFNTVIPAIKRLQTYALERTVIGIGGLK
jgi:hypothetical protein